MHTSATKLTLLELVKLALHIMVQQWLPVCRQWQVWLTRVVQPALDGPCMQHTAVTHCLLAFSQYCALLDAQCNHCVNTQ